jgi:signal transduction histidine kinase
MVALGTAGHGLVAMRERVTMLGGRLDVGPRDGGGWAVAAVLPLSPVPVS